ncbi:hypothetical protein, conserved [Trypanosoma brucei brucei TREU927]|uniref:LisH domain-containing protein n=1 Tax=Trypanosoma brucei brucei (strain 927/4 GUTat10.1) TaxID=185431 RepID=Q387D2_TRYB2|nr:hypothetical protein, conserved [Trypanosoma brucei brucei TREU927]EAN79099.1 hypothetical protein, conserved [Trypanosoma brucei brucei TREU927]
MGDSVIPHHTVVQCIYSFLKAHGYKNSLLALQSESRVPYNTIDVVEIDEASKDTPCVNPKSLERAVLGGKWDVVLHNYVDTLLLPEEIVFALYELIFEELLALGGFVHAARALFTSSPVFANMKRSSGARYARLERMLASFKNENINDVGTGGTEVVPRHLMEKREALLKTLQEAITWNEEPYDGALPAALCRMFSNDGRIGGPPSQQSTMAKGNDAVSVGDASAVCAPTTFLRYPLCCPKKLKSQTLPGGGRPSACIVTPLSRSGGEQRKFTALVVGTTDGVVNILDAESAGPVEGSVKHTDEVLSVTVDAGADGGVAWVAVGYRDGWVKIYNTETRKLVRRFTQVHSGGVTSVVFTGSRAPELFGHRTHLVSGSYDGSVQLLNILSGVSLQRIGDAHHSKYVLSLCGICSESSEDYHVVSAGNDGVLCFWSFSEEKIQRVGHPRALTTIHAALRDDIPTRLLPIDDSGTTKEILVLTRGQWALVLSTCFTNNSAEPLVLTLHCTIYTPRPMFGGCLRVVNTPAQPEPMLTVFLTDRSGTIILYNIEMRWRGSTTVGTTKEFRPVDESSIVVIEHGKTVETLNVAYVPGKLDNLLAYSPSIPAMYLLSWEAEA